MTANPTSHLKAGRGSIPNRFQGVRLACFCAGLMTALLGSASQLERSLPEFYRRSTPVSVTLETVPAPEVRVYAVEDVPPPGWAIEEISDGGFRDPVSGKVKWGPFFDSQPRQLRYAARPEGNYPSEAGWSGVGVFDGAVVETLGRTTARLRSGAVVCSLPEFYPPGQLIQLVWDVTPDPSVRVHAIEDLLPAGWTVQAISGGGAADPATGKLKWGPFFDAQTRRLTCSVRSPSDDLASHVLSGSAWFDDREQAIEGQRTLFVEPSTVERILPGQHTSGVGFWVTNVVSPATWVVGYAVEDGIPAGWTVASVSDGGVFDVTRGRVKWGPFADRLSRRLVYRVTPQSDTGQFEGLARFNTQDVLIGGDQLSLPYPSGLTRLMAERFQAGVTFSVTNRAEPAPGIHAYAVEEWVPVGWKVMSVSHGGGWDLLNGKIKWGPFNDGNSRDLVAILTPPRGSPPVVPFTGSGQFDETPVTTAGVTETRLRVGEIARSVPEVVSSASAFPVRLQVIPAAGVEVYAVEETPPSGWTVSAVSDQGTFDSATGRVKWGPFFDGDLRTLSYQLLPPSGAGEITGRFAGYGFIDGIEVQVGGDSVTRVTGQTATVRLLIQSLSETQVQVEVVGVAGTAYAIEASSDLVAWTGWASGIADAAGSLKRLDAVRPIARFYRIR
ncbi:MAG: hypothetical protein JNN07_18565 [Verrucomicrobiales bacterium]|nr:hypothetical protein [Verrucomicrobiales bacterium]